MNDILLVLFFVFLFSAAISFSYFYIPGIGKYEEVANACFFLSIVGMVVCAIYAFFAIYPFGMGGCEIANYSSVPEVLP
jgi:hypothetical protein